jgi:CheY-like chemotaxis protein
VTTEGTAMAPGILVLGRNQDDLETCQRELTSLGYQPIVTADREKARELLKSERPALLFSDIVALLGTPVRSFCATLATWTLRSRSLS